MITFQLYELSRYIKGELMAEGAAVYARSESEAMEKAWALFARGAAPGEMDHTTFTIDAPAPTAGQE